MWIGSSEVSVAMHVAIIGGGATGILTAVCILRHADTNDQVTLYEPAPLLGTGVAYSTTDESLLLNVRAVQMSAYADQPDHFVAWLTTHKNQPDAEAFVPRAWYAHYLQDTLHVAIRDSNARFRVIPATVNDIDPHNQTIHSSDGQQVSADHIILALGHAPIANPVARWAPAPRRMLNGYDWQTIATQIATDDDIIIIGSGLTMVDTMLALHNHHHRGNITVFSRHGHLPQTHVPRHNYPSFITSEQYGWSVLEVMRLVRAEVAKALAVGIPWQAVIDALRPHTPQLWQHWSLREKKRFLRHVRAHWDIYRHRIAPPIAAIIATLPQIRIHAAQIIDYQEDDTHVNLTVRHRHTDTISTATASVVINCTGPLSDYTVIKNPLVVALRQRGILVADDIRLGIAVDAHGHLCDQHQQVIPWLWTLGPPRKGHAWECIAIPDIRNQADSVATDIFATSTVI
ncbi:MAG: hypothetical protein EBS29_08780 [Chloroflexia bacterium]|nr:hypothetical protein [Chloroflexia bacterium]